MSKARQFITNIEHIELFSVISNQFVEKFEQTLPFYKGSTLFPPVICFHSHNIKNSRKRKYERVAFHPEDQLRAVFRSPGANYVQVRVAYTRGETTLADEPCHELRHNKIPERDGWRLSDRDKGPRAAVSDNYVIKITTARIRTNLSSVSGVSLWLSFERTHDRVCVDVLLLFYRKLWSTVIRDSCNRCWRLCS